MRNPPSISCSTCGGSGVGLSNGARVTCKRCLGEGSIKLTRCQSAYTEGWMGEFFEAYELVGNGILPDAGGWQDQTNDFILMYRAIKGQASECSAQQRKAQERLAKQAKGKR